MSTEKKHLEGDAIQKPDGHQVAITATREQLASLSDDPETARPFEFKYLWNDHRGGGVADFNDSTSDGSEHRWHPQSHILKSPDQTSFSARTSYQRIEEALNRHQGQLMRKIALEQFGVTDPSLIKNASITMATMGLEYVIFKIEAEPSIDFIVATSKNSACNEAMEIDYRTSRELRMHEARCKGIAEGSEEWKSPTGLSVLPHFHYESGDSERPALLMSPDIPDSYGMYVDSGRYYEEGGTLRLGQSSSGKKVITIDSTIRGEYFLEGDSDPRNDLFYQLALHQLTLATSGRVIYPSFYYADYIYIPSLKKPLLTHCRSSEFIERTYTSKYFFGHMYAPGPMADTYCSAVESCFVQTLHLIFLIYGAVSVYPLNQVVRALLEATKNLEPDEKKQLYQRLLKEEPNPPLMPENLPASTSVGLSKIFGRRLREFRKKLSRELKKEKGAF